MIQSSLPVSLQMSWIDWEGDKYTLEGEWQYATNAIPAIRKDHESSTRDKGNEKKGRRSSPRR